MVRGWWNPSTLARTTGTPSAPSAAPSSSANQVLPVPSTPSTATRRRGGRESAAGTLDVRDPSTDEVLTSIADASPADGDAALRAAAGAQAAWAATAPRERGEVLRRAYELLTERADDLALLMTLEMGKPVAESKGEIAYAAEFFRWFAEEAVRVEGDYRVAPAGGMRILTMRQPVGQ